MTMGDAWKRVQDGSAAVAAVALCALLATYGTLAERPSCTAVAEEAPSSQQAAPTENRPADGDGQGRARDEASSEPTSPCPAEAVAALLQHPDLPAGCETVSLAITLRSYGFAADPVDLVERFLPVDDSGADFVDRFAGDPYVAGSAYPPAIAEAANGYLGEQGSDVRAHDLTGSTFDELLSLVQDGKPVLVWTTMRYEDPLFTGKTFQDRAWYANEHCVVLYGIEGGEVLVSDPLEGLAARDAQRFQDLYETCGSMALALE